MTTVPNRQNELEKAVCLKADAEFQTAIRDWDHLPISEERRRKSEENIKQARGRGEVFNKSEEIAIDYYLLPLIKKLIQIEYDLRVANHAPFMEDRIVALREYLQNLVRENWPYIVRHAYEDAITYVIDHNSGGHLHQYQEDELKEMRDRHLKIEPNELFRIIDELLQKASADSKIHALPPKEESMETPEEKRKKMIIKIVGGLVVLVLVLIGFSILPPLGSVLWLLFLIIAYPLVIAFTTAEQSMDNANLVEMYKKGLSEVPVLGEIFGKFFKSNQK